MIIILEEAGAHNYDLCINSSRLGIEVTAEKLVEMIRELEKAMSPVNFDL